jgi:protein tyrosine/serine phosphatase
VTKVKQLLLQAWYWILAFLGRTPTTVTHNIPNLQQVKPGLWRSGQPQNVFDWEYLRVLGITRAIKLNFETECSDSSARIAGITSYMMSVQPEEDKNLISNITNTFARPDAKVIEAAEKLIDPSVGTLVHCTHGQDRTGYLIGRYRVNAERWSKNEAYLEMLKFGFHPELYGLHKAWEDFTPTIKKR